jgi:hypothetical protein
MLRSAGSGRTRRRCSVCATRLRPWAAARSARVCPRPAWRQARESPSRGWHFRPVRPRLGIQTVWPVLVFGSVVGAASSPAPRPTRRSSGRGLCIGLRSWAFPPAPLSSGVGLFGAGHVAVGWLRPQALGRAAPVGFDPFAPRGFGLGRGPQCAGLSQARRGRNPAWRKPGLAFPPRPA